MPTFLRRSNLPLVLVPPNPDQRAYQRAAFSAAARKRSFPGLVVKLVERIGAWEQLPPGPARDQMRRFATVFTVDELLAWVGQTVATVIDDPSRLKDVPKDTPPGDLPVLPKGASKRQHGKKAIHAKYAINLGPLRLDEDDVEEISDFLDDEEIETDCHVIAMDFAICYEITQCTRSFCTWYGVCFEMGTVEYWRPLDGCTPAS
jgi:hypothetical protein